MDTEFGTEPVNGKKKLWMDILIAAIVVGIPLGIWGNTPGNAISYALLGLIITGIAFVVFRHWHRKGKFQDQKFLYGLGGVAVIIIAIIASNGNDSINGKSFFAPTPKLPGNESNIEYMFDNGTFRRVVMDFDVYNNPAGVTEQNGTYVEHGDSVNCTYNNGRTFTLLYHGSYIMDGSLKLEDDKGFKE